MGGSTVRVAITTTLLLALVPAQAGAQSPALLSVVVLPFPAGSVTDSTVAWGLYEGFLSGMRTTPGVHVTSRQEAIELLDGELVPEILSRRDRLEEFAVRTSSDFIVGGLVEGIEGGGLEVSTMVYSREERRVTEVSRQVYRDPGEAMNTIPSLGRQVSHPRNFSPSDTPLIYSMFIPGMGQLASGEPVRAVLAAGLVAGAAYYGLSTPAADRFRLDFSDFNSIWNSSSGDYDYFVRQLPVTKEEFFDTLTQERDHHLRADAERRARAVRRRRAGGLFAAAYILNLVDTVIITRRTVDDRAFFLRVESFLQERGPDGAFAAGLRLLMRIP